MDVLLVQHIFDGADLVPRSRVWPPCCDTVLSTALGASPLLFPPGGLHVSGVPEDDGGGWGRLLPAVSGTADVSDGDDGSGIGQREASDLMGKVVIKWSPKFLEGASLSCLHLFLSFLQRIFILLFNGSYCY